MDKNNIILIVTDQHRLDTLKYANTSTVVSTPALDALSVESICFDRAYTSCPVCTPARASLHSGFYPSATGMCTNIYGAGSTTHEIMDSPNLLSRRLIKQGYNCGFTGKWHLGLGRDKTASSEGRELLARMSRGDMCAGAYLDYGTLPGDIGFIGDDFPGHGNGGWKTPQFEKYLEDNNLKLTIEGVYGGKLPGQHSHGGVITSGIESTVEYYLINRSIEITNQFSSAGSPFFFCLNIWGPHEPYNVPAEYFGKYRHMNIPPWKSFGGDGVATPVHNMVRRPEMDWSFFENNLRHYYAYVEHIDAQIGRYIDYLKAAGIYEDSTIIFTADHGDSQGSHNGLENKSCHMYDEIMKIPLIIKPSGGTPQRLEHGFAGTTDIYATILRLAGDSGGTNSGVPLNHYWDNSPGEPRKDIVSEGTGAFPLIASQRMYCTGNLKYIFNFGGNDELYNLKDDPDEMRNLASMPENQALLKELRESLAERMKEHFDPAAQFFCKYFGILDYAVK